MYKTHALECSLHPKSSGADLVEKNARIHSDCCVHHKAKKNITCHKHASGHGHQIPFHGSK